MNNYIYRVVSLEDWNQTQKLGCVPRCGADDRDGFVHLSTEETMLETANLYFETSEQPLILEIDPKVLGEDLKWEEVESRGGAEFPHLYSDGIPLQAVRAAIVLDHTERFGFSLGHKKELT